MQHKTADQQLVKRLKDGDSSAMPELHANYGGRVFQTGVSPYEEPRGRRRNHRHPA